MLVVGGLGIEAGCVLWRAVFCQGESSGWAASLVSAEWWVGVSRQWSALVWRLLKTI